MKRFAFVLFGLMLWTSIASAQSYPSRVVTMVVPFPPGGSYDVVGRLIAQGLSERWKKQVIIENKGGVAGDIGAYRVATAASDGYTLLLWGDGILINQALLSKRQFDATKSFEAVTLAARSPQLLVARKGLNINDLARLLQVAKDNKTDVRFGTAGAGTPGHLAAELLAAKSQSALRHVPYRGGAPALTDLLAEQIELVSTGLPALISSVRSGAVVPIAVSSEKRSPILPDVPSMNEIVPGVFLDTWYGILAPAGTPHDIIAKISGDVSEVLKDANIRERLKEQGFEVVGSSPEELRSLMVRDLPRWKDIVELARLKPADN